MMTTMDAVLLRRDLAMAGPKLGLTGGDLAEIESRLALIGVLSGVGADWDQMPLPGQAPSPRADQPML
ncbi:hypothetical protein ACEYYB_04635 [Paracoccus sp. p4-l81]|uniref:hypothetical protein n=1 Tax=unclassified Paracoccus (in: a-proteobacteria) TaxID=2688777 RepID=UPI0035BB049A